MMQSLLYEDREHTINAQCTQSTLSSAVHVLTLTFQSRLYLTPVPEEMETGFIPSPVHVQYLMI